MVTTKVAYSVCISVSEKTSVHVVEKEKILDMKLVADPSIFSESKKAYVSVFNYNSPTLNQLGSRYWVVNTFNSHEDSRTADGKSWKIVRLAIIPWDRLSFRDFHCYHLQPGLPPCSKMFPCLG